MSINWVMLSPASDDFVRLPGEQKLYTSPPRVSISLDSIEQYPGRQPYHLASSSGRVFLTNRRLIYLPTTPPTTTATPPPPTTLASFAAPLAHIHDARIAAPWFGPNAWVAAVQPVAGGGIPGRHAAVQLRLTCSDGGAYELHTRFCDLRERLAAAREARGGAGAGSGESDVQHLEQLPSYEESGSAPVVVLQGTAAGGAAVASSSQGQGQGQGLNGHVQGDRQGQPAGVPMEPPPGYEEAQRDGVSELLESRLRMET